MKTENRDILNRGGLGTGGVTLRDGEGAVSATQRHAHRQGTVVDHDEAGEAVAVEVPRRHCRGESADGVTGGRHKARQGAPLQDLNSRSEK